MKTNVFVCVLSVYMMFHPAVLSNLLSHSSLMNDSWQQHRPHVRVGIWNRRRMKHVRLKAAYECSWFRIQDREPTLPPEGEQPTLDAVRFGKMFFAHTWSMLVIIMGPRSLNDSSWFTIETLSKYINVSPSLINWCLAPSCQSLILIRAQHPASCLWILY